ncbi:unnamed protein product [Polarella glacialis]|uniref:t-SNARE coiled-coil homology domain-containing protein n=1 Tax=Polarella glacialis TaxID=89957 RepID=A0A813EWN0_POLGL|nr:unnamed protein product [Polarella glacialis]
MPVSSFLLSASSGFLNCIQRNFDKSFVSGFVNFSPSFTLSSVFTAVMEYEVGERIQTECYTNEQLRLVWAYSAFASYCFQTELLHSLALGLGAMNMRGSLAHAGRNEDFRTPNNVLLLMVIACQLHVGGVPVADVVLAAHAAAYRFGDVTIRNRIAQEREEGIRRIQSQVHEVNQIFRDLASIVQEQGHDLETVAGTTQSASSNTKQARQRGPWSKFPSRLDRKGQVLLQVSIAPL